MTNQDTDTHPRVDQWSNGVNQADELNRLMKVRRAALNRLGEHTIRNGAPMATIEEPLVPIFMYHRYAVESTASMVGGIDYIYGMRGDGRTPVKWETAANQRKALDALADTLKPAELAVPKQVLDAIPPRPPGFGRHRELFPRTTGDGFDPLSPATIAADVTIGFTLQLDRAARMVAQHAVDPTLPGLEEVIDRLTKATFDAPAATPYRSRNPPRRGTRAGGSADVAGDGRAERPGPRHRHLEAHPPGTAPRVHGSHDEADQAQHMLLAADIKRFLERPAETVRMHARARRASRSAHRRYAARTGWHHRHGTSEVHFRFSRRSQNLRENTRIGVKGSLLLRLSEQPKIDGVRHSLIPRIVRMQMIAWIEFGPQSLRILRVSRGRLEIHYAIESATGADEVVTADVAPPRRYRGSSPRRLVRRQRAPDDLDAVRVGALDNLLVRRDQLVRRGGLCGRRRPRGRCR